MKCAVVIAHPDDELLFTGAMMLTHPDYEWHVVCLTGRGGDRYDGFDLSCRRLGAQGEIHDVHDEGMVWTPAEYLQARSIILGADLAQYDQVFTHSPKGCYGHPHHIGVSDIVTTIRPDAWRFYTPTLTGIGWAWAGETLWSFAATARKAEIFREAYGQALLDSLHHDHTYLMPQLFEKEWFTR
jgi:LmbE family N-acetylglucosaminyl deacetylase